MAGLGREWDFLRRLRKGENKVLKEIGIPDEWIFWVYRYYRSYRERSCRWNIPGIRSSQCPYTLSSCAISADRANPKHASGNEQIKHEICYNRQK